MRGDALKRSDTSQVFTGGFVINQTLVQGGLNADVSWKAALEVEPKSWRVLTHPKKHVLTGPADRK